MDWYMSFFKDAPPQARAIGELSHGYLFSKEAAERIAHDLSGAHLLTTLRNPIDRSFSHYLYLLSGGLVTGSFEEVLDNRPGVIRSSLYSEPLSYYLDRFDRTHLHVLFFDDLKADAKAFAGKIFNILNIDPVDDIQYQKKVRAARMARSPMLAKIAKQGALIARDMGLTRLVGAVKNGPLAHALYKDYQQDKKPVMSGDTRKRLADLFEPDVHKLEQMLGTDLSHWLTC
jgi:hypothetical protein